MQNVIICKFTSKSFQVIIEKYSKSKVDVLERNKFLIPSDMTIGQLHLLLRKRRLDPKVGFWFFVKDLIPSASMTMGQLYQENKDDDGFLYIAYSDENVFGLQIH